MRVARFAGLGLGLVLLTVGCADAAQDAAYITVNSDTYQAAVGDYRGAAIVFFYADWCPFSGSLLPIYADIEKEYAKEVKFFRFPLGKEYMDFESEAGQARWQALKEKYGVEIIPTLIMRNQGAEIDRMSGRPEKELVESYRQLLKDWITANILIPEANPPRFNGTLRLHKREN